MSSTRFLALLVAAAALTVGARLLGEWVRVAALVGLGGAGLYGFLRVEVAKLQFVRALRGQPERDTARVLHALENVAERVELAERLGATPPPVALRGGRERFVYPAAARAQAWWTMWASAALAALVVLLGATTSFATTADLLAWLALAAAFAAGALLMRRWLATTHVIVEATDDALRIRHPDGTTEALPWHEITTVREQSLLQSFTVQSPATRVTVWQTLGGYGRLVNIVATRVPEGVRWRAT